MLERFRAAGLVWPTVLAMPVLMLLAGLGTWQMSRKAWKESLQRQIEQRAVQAPVPLGPDLKAEGRGPADIEYLRVRARGRLLHGQERHMYWLSAGRAGWLVLTPLVLEDGRIVMVNRGWVPEPLKERSRRPEEAPAGAAEVVGLLRGVDRPGMFTPLNDPVRNVWFWRDVDRMLACHNEAPESADCTALTRAAASYPFTIDAEADPANPAGWPRGGTTNLNLPNRHLEYAMTWYGLAATLVGVWIAFVAGRLRAAGPTPPAGARAVDS